MPLRAWTGSFMKSSFDRLADFNNKLKAEDCMWMPTNDLNTILDVNWAHFIKFKVNNKWICRKSSLPSPVIKQWTGSTLHKTKNTYIHRIPVHIEIIQRSKTASHNTTTVYFFPSRSIFTISVSSVWKYNSITLRNMYVCHFQHHDLVLWRLNAIWRPL